MLITTLVMAALVVAAGALLHRRDPGAVGPAVRRALADAGRVGLRLPFAVLFASFAAALVPEAWVQAALGRESGIGGLAVATVAGALLPGGPFVAFPLAIGLAERGAGVPQLVALVTAWSVLGVNRIVAFELPVVGARFVALRVLASSPLPLLAGLLATAVAR